MASYRGTSRVTSRLDLGSGQGSGSSQTRLQIYAVVLSQKLRGLVMGVREIDQSLRRWEMNAKSVHRRMILAPTPRERERWHAVWLLAQGWTAAATVGARHWSGTPTPSDVGPRPSAREGLRP